MYLCIRYIALCWQSTCIYKFWMKLSQESYESISYVYTTLLLCMILSNLCNFESNWVFHTRSAKRCNASIFHIQSWIILPSSNFIAVRDNSYISCFSKFIIYKRPCFTRIKNTNFICCFMIFYYYIKQSIQHYIS